MKKQPYRYQKKCLGKLDQAVKAKKKAALVVLATGLGKTFVSALHALAFIRKHGGRVLYLCHQNEILGQARETFEEVFGPSYTFGDYHGHEKTLHGVDVLFASFQTFAEHRKKFARDEFTYIIIDEGHHSHAATYRPTILYFQPKFALCMTATPDRQDLQDIRSLFGKEIFSLPLEEAVARGYLTPIDYRLLTDDIMELGVLDTPVGQLSLKKLNRRLFAPRRDREIARLILGRIRKVRKPRVLVFCPSIAHCNRLQELLPQSATVHSKVPRKIRKERIQALKGGQLNIILTVDVFNEGMDVPEANVLVFLRSTSSLTVFLQQLGRGLRRYAGKETVLVLDFIANCERILKISELWQRVQGFRAITRKARRGRYRIDEPINVDIGQIDFTETARRILDTIRQIRLGWGGNREGMLQVLRNLAVELGRTPAMKDLDTAKGHPSHQTYRDHFGSYTAALAAAGLVARRKPWKKEEALTALRRLRKALGRTPKQVDLLKRYDFPVPSGTVYLKNFGGFAKALRLAGLKQNRNPKVSRRALLQQLQAEARRHDGQFTLNHIHEAIKRHRVTHVPAFKREFGSLRQAIVIARVNCRIPTSYNKKVIAAQIRKLARKLGRRPLIADIKAASARGECASMSTIVNYYGGLNKAVRAAGLKPFGWRHTKLSLIKKLHAYARQLGRRPTVDDMRVPQTDRPCPNLWAYIQAFGSWKEALKKAKM